MDVILKEFSKDTVLLSSKSMKVSEYNMRYERNCDNFEFYIVNLYVDGKVCKYIIDVHTDNDLHLVFIKAFQNSINTNTCLLLTVEKIAHPEDSRYTCFKILSIGGTLK